MRCKVIIINAKCPKAKGNDEGKKRSGIRRRKRMMARKEHENSLFSIHG